MQFGHRYSADLQPLLLPLAGWAACFTRAGSWLLAASLVEQLRVVVVPTTLLAGRRHGARDAQLTTDPTPKARALLDALAAHGVRASFFAIGRRLEQPGARATLERVRDEGHWIGNHGYSHRTPLGLDRSQDAAAREIDGTEALLGALAHPDRLFRPFGGGGHLDASLLSAALASLSAGRHTLVLWAKKPRDCGTRVGSSAPWRRSPTGTVAGGARRRARHAGPAAALPGRPARGRSHAGAGVPRGVCRWRGVVRAPLDAYVAD